ncbi:MAG: DEAD/DEAH box helicase [Actinomycetota bacterium]
MTTAPSSVTPSEAPDPAVEDTTITFADLGVSAPVMAALARDDIVSPFEIQTLVMQDALAGRDILGKSRTGSGKTLAFGIPIVDRVAESPATPAALVLVPTRELASQVTEAMRSIARARKLRVAPVYGGIGMADQARRASSAHVIVATPGRLEDLANRRMISLSTISILVLDEADRMLDMGFAPQVDRILRRISKERQTMLFSATLDGEVARLAAACTRNPATHTVDSPIETVDEVDHQFVLVPDGNKVEALVKLLAAEDERTLVFVRTKHGSDRLASKLNHLGLSATALNGDMTQVAREKALARFDEGKVKTLCATDVAARGLDLDDITRVVNFDPPADFKDYVHRVGRTGRAGRSGTGITLVLPDQAGDVGRIAARLKLNTQFEEAGLKVPAPEKAYSSHRGRGSLLGRRRRRPF